MQPLCFISAYEKSQHPAECSPLALNDAVKASCAILCSPGQHGAKSARPVASLALACWGGRRLAQSWRLSKGRWSAAGAAPCGAGCGGPLGGPLPGNEPSLGAWLVHALLLWFPLDRFLHANPNSTLTVLRLRHPGRQHEGRLIHVPECFM